MWHHVTLADGAQRPPGQVVLVGFEKGAGFGPQVEGDGRVEAEALCRRGDLVRHLLANSAKVVLHEMVRATSSVI